MRRASRCWVLGNLSVVIVKSRLFDSDPGYVSGTKINDCRISTCNSKIQTPLLMHELYLHPVINLTDRFFSEIGIYFKVLSNVYASRFERKLTNGRTQPCLITCDSGGDDIELIVKVSAGCFEKEKNLIVEAVAAMLAADIGLPVPEPFLVHLDALFVQSIQDNELRTFLSSASPIAFGSRKLPDGFSVWPSEAVVIESLSETAAEVYVFDAIIVNSDRRPVNPNCLFSGRQIGIFDHELAFKQNSVLFWKEPWVDGGLNGLDDHIFAPRYFEKKVKNLNRFESAWGAITEQRLAEYQQALPSEWAGYESFISETMDYLLQVKNNISKVVDLGLEKFHE